MWSINIQPVTHQCHAVGLVLRHWITPLCTQSINILCGQWKYTLCRCFSATFLSLPIYFVILSLFEAEQRKVYFVQITQITEKMWPVHVGMQITACCLWHHALTNSAMCCVGAQGQLWNSVVLVWCCVFCLERRVVIKLTSSWVRCCQALTHRTLLSHLSALYPVPWFFSFFSTVEHEQGKIKVDSDSYPLC